MDSPLIAVAMLGLGRSRVRRDPSERRIRVSWTQRLIAWFTGAQWRT